MNWFDLSCVSAVARSIQRTSVKMKVSVPAANTILNVCVYIEC
jgi:hypothetical protein